MRRRRPATGRPPARARHRDEPGPRPRRRHEMGAHLGTRSFAVAHRRHAARLHEPVRVGDPDRRHPDARARRRPALGGALGRLLADAPRRTDGTAADGWCGSTPARATCPASRGDVDLDRVAGTDLGAITIRRLTSRSTGGAGRVTSSPAGLGCATSCSRQHRPGRRRHAHRRAGRRAHFTGWSGACAGAAPHLHGHDGTEPQRRRPLRDRHRGADRARRRRRRACSAPSLVRFDEAVRGVTSSNLRPARGGGATRARSTASAARAQARSWRATRPRAIRHADGPRRPSCRGGLPGGAEPRRARRRRCATAAGNVAATVRTPFEAVDGRSSRRARP